MNKLAVSAISDENKNTNSDAFSQQANYTDQTMPLVGEVSANFCE
jgi:hypothetical protein